MRTIKVKKGASPKKGYVVCLILVGNSWVVGNNDRLDISKKYEKVTRDGQRKRYSRHAEEHALSLAKKKGGKIRRVIVLRWLKKGAVHSVMAKPCPSCHSLLNEAGVKDRDIFYSDWNGEIRCMNESSETE